MGTLRSQRLSLGGTWYPHAPHSRLTGYKWFTSAADGEAGMALAREAGSPGLTLFYVPVARDDSGCPQARGGCRG